MSAASLLVVVAIIIYFVFYKPSKDMAAEANNKAAELAKYFGDVKVECIELEGKKESNIDRIYVLFGGNHHSDPKNRYQIIETVYKSWSDREKEKARERVIAILRALPYGPIGIGGSAYKADDFFEKRERGVFLESEKRFDELWEARNRDMK